MKICELSLAQNQVGAAAAVLEQFLSEYQQAPMADLAMLSLGGLRLRQHLEQLDTNRTDLAATNAPTTGNPTNRLEQAVAAFSTLTNKLPRSPLVGQAQLGLGWCFWLMDRLAESERAFVAAAEKLPALSADQATAYFKLADSQLAQKQFAPAIANYSTLISHFASVPAAATNLFEPALYQTVRAGLEAGDMAAATNALARILAWYPRGFVSAGAVLLTGQAMSRHADPGGARKLFLDFAQKAPDSPLLPEIQLAIARTYEQENRWDEAIAQYSSCLGGSTNPDQRARAEYWRACATDQAGRPTNALVLFTNFVAQNPNHELTPRAQWWVADYYLRTGNLVEAEGVYQQISANTNLQNSPLAYQAELWAGRAAFARQSWQDAHRHFTNLTSNLSCPMELRVEAMFALGDTLMMWSGVETNKLANYGEAIRVFTAIGELYPTNRLAVLALGQKANCLMQWGQLDAAANAYEQMIESPLADANARSTAKVGLAVVLEKQAAEAPASERKALLKRAFDECLDVLLGENQEPDAFWVKEAGLKALRLAEAMGDWESTIKVCKKLAELLPSLRPALEERRLKAEKNLEDTGKAPTTKLQAPDKGQTPILIAKAQV
jgi:TolA-binding protein